MFALIAWSQYWELVLVALVLYYGLLVIRFYGRKGSSASGRRGLAVEGATALKGRGLFPKRRSGTEEVRQAVLVTEAGGLTEGSEQWEAMNLLVVQLKGLIGEAAVAGASKEELMGWIQGLFFLHRELQGTGEAVAVNELLKRVCLQELSLELREKDIEWLWRGKAAGEKKANGPSQAAIFGVVLAAGLVGIA